MKAGDLTPRFVYHPVREWAPLSWLAICSRTAPRVTVFHGCRVEVHDGFFSEAVWAGDYAAGDLDATDVLAGTGARIRDGGVVFASSGSTLDRLCVHEVPSEVRISNSLPCLLSALDATVDPTYSRYYEDFYSIVRGITAYRRTLRTTAGEVQLVYFDNLMWDGASLIRRAKPGGTEDFSSFASYRGFLERAMLSMAANMRSASRAHSIEMLATASTGYDSPTVAALARAVDCREALCFDVSHRGESDSGEEIARYLGIQAIPVADSGWRNSVCPEVPFIASNSMGEEVRFRSAEPHLSGKLLLTGYHGDKVWDVHTHALGPSLVRGDPSGLALSEYRLWAGFIHSPVPFWGARQIEAINAISKSDEVQPWRLGGDYDRPICRRIVEESGVPRHLFGIHKRNASVILHNYDEFLTPGSMEDYLAWLRDHRVDWLRKKQMPPITSVRLDRSIHAAADAFGRWGKRLPGLWRWAGRVEGKPTYLRKFLFPWAVERAKERYVRPPELRAPTRNAEGT